MIPLGAQKIAETARWLVINKPAGWLTIPGHASDADPVLSTWAQEHFGRVWVVHRLDRETSGVVLFARSAEAHRQANIWFSSHQVRKTYSCLAKGQPSTPMFKIKTPIRGLHCVTQVEVRESYQLGEDQSAFFAAVKPLTGRRHQIRIHLASEGFPLWGDTRYSGPPEVVVRGEKLPIARVALHAAKLELPADHSSEQATFEAPWPEDFETWVRRVRG